VASGAVLFDLDGTFADTAADLAAALNRLREEQGLEPLPVERVRPFASAGARGMIAASFGLKPGHAEYEALRSAFLEFYDERTCVETTLFPGIADLLDELEGRRIAWGIVTNKTLRFTEKILYALGVNPACVVGGDSTPHLKPHPAPLLLAAEKLRIPGEDCFYLGDDLRDIQAARAAGMRPIAVNWGYHHPDSGHPSSWQAAAVIDAPQDLLAHL
jgi:N-acetyl-D-muramate 6-phosphate phosphatase